jgi:2-(1,2-epoxy-1,2-dihydrophenyl)acetyl-CoA isomerase
MATILCEISNGIATVTMNRPEAMNALNYELGSELGATMQQVGEDDAVRCVVVCGAGPNFMAGGDLAYFQNLKKTGAPKELWDKLFKGAHGVMRAMANMPKPVIAAVEGAVAGYGFSLMSACDLVVAADDAVFTLAYSLVGLSPDGGSTYSLPRTIGVKKTMELMLLSDRYSADELKELGLLNRVTPKGEALSEALKLAARIAKGPRLAYANGKALVGASLNSTLDQQLDAEQERFIQCAMSDDFDEGLDAFFGKRRPDFGKG